jgi:hypothetical protein
MMNHRVVWIAGALLGVVACTSASSERQARVEQRVEVDDGGAEGGADAGVTCAHPLCATGDALAASCDACATQLCAADPYCCGVTWDATCVGEVTSICGKSCAEEPKPDAGDGGMACAHPICAAGVPLAPTCDSCAAKLCAQDPYCCAVAWDATCVGEVASICGLTCQ